MAGPLFAIPYAATSGRNARVILSNQIIGAGEFNVDVQAADISVRIFELLDPK